jgi:hypothetical protein
MEIFDVARDLAINTLSAYFSSRFKCQDIILVLSGLNFNVHSLVILSVVLSLSGVQRSSERKVCMSVCPYYASIRNNVYTFSSLQLYLT